MLSYTQIKWLILLVPAVAIGLWEYIRHEFLLPYLSMNAGNILSPFIVLAIILLVNRRLFHVLERHQEELEEEKMKQAVMEERQAISRELHDSISQSLFLLGVKINKLRNREDNEEKQWQQIDNTIMSIQKNVRESIKQLRKHEPVIQKWDAALEELIEHVKETLPTVRIENDWNLNDEIWNMEEKVQAYFILREALTNIIKHASRVKQVGLYSTNTDKGWEFQVTDDGDPCEIDTPKTSHYGMEMMRDRANKMGWEFSYERVQNKTIVSVRYKGGNI
ncbi:sensor histidine kinase [Halobacillus sp. MO56]